jgi:phage protein D
VVALNNLSARYVHRRAAYELVVDGRRINNQVEPRLISLRLREKRAAEADELEIVLDDHDGALAIPPAGATITLKMGWMDLTEENPTPQLVDKGEFKVDDRGHEGVPDRLVLSAKSADLTKQFRTRNTRTWSNTTLGAVLGDLAARNGWQSAVSADMAQIPVEHISQSRESDAAFLSRLGRIHDADATVKGGKLIFMPAGGGRAPSGEVFPDFTITRMSGDRHRWQAAEREKHSGVVAEWNDRAGGRRRQVVVGSEDNAKKLGRTYASEASARRAAETESSRQDRKGALLSLDLAIGDVTLFPSRQGKVHGFKPEIDGSRWVIIETEHSLDAAGGLRTALQMELGGAKTGKKE